MALKTFKPYTKSTRGTILVDRTGLWKGKPFKSLVSPKNSMKGRNNNGHITSVNREMRRKFNLKQAKREEVLTSGWNIGKGTMKKKETYKAGKDRSEKAEFGQRLETKI